MQRDRDRLTVLTVGSRGGARCRQVLAEDSIELTGHDGILLRNMGSREDPLRRGSFEM